MPVRTYILIITLNVNGVSVATKNRNWLNGYKNKTCMYALYKRLTSDLGHIQTESEGVEKDIPWK